MADANPGPSTPAGMTPEPTGLPDAQVAHRTHHLLMLEFGDRADFDNPRLEWRRLFSELLGTFALVLVAAGGGLLHAKGQISLGAAVVAPGLMVLAIILFMGAISGAHLNPAVSLAFALRGDFPWKRVPGYVIIQLLGAALACLFLLGVFGNIEHLGATLPGPGYADWQALLMEIVLTTLLVSVILGTASAAQNVGAIAALGVGGYIALAGLWAAPVSGVSMNPRAVLRPGAGQRPLDVLLGVRAGHDRLHAGAGAGAERHRQGLRGLRPLVLRGALADVHESVVLDRRDLLGLRGQ